MAFTASPMDSLQNLVDMLHYDITKLKQERLGPEIVNFGLIVNHVRDCVELLVVTDNGTDRHHICHRNEIYNGMSTAMAAGLIIGHAREIVRFYPPQATTMVGADEYDDIMQAQEIMNAL